MKKILLMTLIIILALSVNVGLTADDWQTPTSGSGWTDNSNAWDDDTGTRASYDIIPFSSSGYIIFNIGAIPCNKVRLWAGRESTDINTVVLSVYYNADWHTILVGDILWDEWVEVELGGTYLVTNARAYMSNGHLTEYRYAYFYEFDFNQVPHWPGPWNTKEISKWNTKEIMKWNTIE